MIEIILLVFLCKKNAEIVKEKGRKPGVFALITVGLWFGMEFLGAFIGSLISGGEVLVLPIIFALSFAALSAVISRSIAKNCKPGTNFTPPTEPKNAELLEEPATIKIVREANPAGAYVKWSFIINGLNAGILSDGNMMEIKTNLKRNILVAKDTMDNVTSPFEFEVESAAKAAIYFGENDFLPEKCMGIKVVKIPEAMPKQISEPVEPPQAPQTPQPPQEPQTSQEPQATQEVQATQEPQTSQEPQAPQIPQPPQAPQATQEVQATQVLFCNKCGLRLTNDDKFCPDCGAPKITVK